MSQESRLFRESFSRRHLEFLVLAAHEAVRLGDRQAAKFGKGQLVEIAPALRRGHLHKTLLDQPWGPTFEVSLERCESGNANHIIIEGPRTVLTALTRSSMPRELPEPPYRSRLAQAVQMDLFNPEKERRVERPDKLFSVLLFGGPIELRRPEVSLARVVFPDPHGRFATGTIDLLAEHQALLASLRVPKRATETAPEAQVRSRRSAKEDSADEGDRQ